MDEMKNGMDNKMQIANSLSDQAQFASAKTQIKEMFSDKQMREFAERDLAYGINVEDIKLYSERQNLGYECIVQLSRALKVTNGRELFLFLRDSNLSHYQMKTVIDFYEKGIPFDKLREIASVKQTGHSLHDALANLYNAYRDAKEKSVLEMRNMQTEQGQNIREMNEKIEDVLVQIAEVMPRIEKIQQESEKLQSGSLVSAEIDKVRQEYSEKISNNEAMINNQQDTINSLKRELTGFQNNAQNISEIKAELADTKAKLAVAEEERDKAFLRISDMEKEIEDMKREKDELDRELEALKEQKKQEEETKDKGKEPEIKKEAKPATPDADYEMKVGPGKIRVQAERLEKRNPKTLLAMAGRFLKGTTMEDLLQSMADAGIDCQKMQIIGGALQKGITPSQAVDIINCGFDTAEMEQAVEIMLLEKNYG